MRRNQHEFVLVLVVVGRRRRGFGRRTIKGIGATMKRDGTAIHGRIKRIGSGTALLGRTRSRKRSRWQGNRRIGIKRIAARVSWLTLTL
jgi:hypothetical protein